MASHGAAMQAIKRFRRRELADLMGHLRIFGALPEPAPSATPAKLGENIVLPNPFLPKKNPKTGNWRPPKYSLRRQAELVKMAKISGTLSTLPPGPKTFAAKLREERVQNALSPAATALLAAQAAKAKQSASKKPKPAEKRLSPARRIATLEKDIATVREQLPELKDRLRAVVSEYDLGELVVFEGGGKIDKAQLAKQRAEQDRRAKDIASLESQIQEIESSISSKEQQIEDIRFRQARRAAIKRSAIKWDKVIWAGEAKPKTNAGVQSGTRLYAGRKRMFKGHLWERKRAERIKKHTILMRDMAARVERYKNYYKKRRPNPLKPSRSTKPPKLPF